MSESRFNERESMLNAKRGVFSTVNELFAEQPERVFLGDATKQKKGHVARWAIVTTPHGISYLVDVDTKHSPQGVLLDYSVKGRVINLDVLTIRHGRNYEQYSFSLTSDLITNALYTAKYRSTATKVHQEAPVIIENQWTLPIKALNILRDEFALSSLEHEEDAVALIQSEAERRANPTPEQLEKLVQILKIGKEFPYRED